jgi:hypothetical protein
VRDVEADASRRFRQSGFAVIADSEGDVARFDAADGAEATSHYGTGDGELPAPGRHPQAVGPFLFVGAQEAAGEDKGLPRQLVEQEEAHRRLCT